MVNWSTLVNSDQILDHIFLRQNLTSEPSKRYSEPEDPEQHGLNETNEFQGAKVKMDESGNILLKRLGKSPVYVKVKMLILMMHTVIEQGIDDRSEKQSG